MTNKQDVKNLEAKEKELLKIIVDEFRMTYCEMKVNLTTYDMVVDLEYAGCFVKIRCDYLDNGYIYYIISAEQKYDVPKKLIKGTYSINVLISYMRDTFKKLGFEKMEK